MKITKLLVLALTAALLCGSVNVKAYAAEATTAETVTDVESTEKSTNENTEALEDTSVTEEKSEETKEAAQTEEETKIEVTEEKTDTKKTEVENTKKEEEENTALKDKIEVKAIKKQELAYTEAQLRLLSALIFCEAGAEPYAGKLAVGIVVMNRVESKSFPNTLDGVVYQKYQFGPARNGSLKTALANYDAGKFTAQSHKDSIKAAKAALEGAKAVMHNGRELDMKSMLFFSGRVSGAKLSIANHQFK